MMKFRKTAATALAALAFAGVAGPASADSALHSAKPVRGYKPSAYSDGRWDGKLPLAEPGDDGEE